ncbi:SH3 domain-containing protein [Aureimonas sp. AU4]|uniref:SH3 domain-containing protein n=1 Tax=Aureimonas sp. AU4 TaxID=1638163 RepID=UPI0007802A8D|nr:SH3 domain-containing protein [Aureimonas sp. AU4]
MPLRLRSLLALAALVLAPEIAQAATAIATTNVNLRAGPSTRYPAVNVVQGGEDVHVFGCLANRSWCDVDFYGQRGWMSSDYLAFVRGGRRYTGPEVVGYIGAPVVTYSFGRYWDDHYRDRDFYRDRRRWDGIAGPPIFDRGPPPRARDRIGPPPPYVVRGERGYDDRGYDGRDRFERERDRFEGRRDRERFEDRRRFEDGPPPPWVRDRGPGRPDWDREGDLE